MPLTSIPNKSLPNTDLRLCDLPKVALSNYAMRLFPEVRPDWFVGWSEQYLDELIYHEMRSPETTNGDAAPEGGTAAVLTDSRLVCISDGKAPRKELSS